MRRFLLILLSIILILVVTPIIFFAIIGGIVGYFAADFACAQDPVLQDFEILVKIFAVVFGAILFSEVGLRVGILSIFFRRR